MNRTQLLSVVVGVSNTPHPIFPDKASADGSRPEWARVNAIHDAFRSDLDRVGCADITSAERFRFHGYSQERLWAARWLLFEFPEVRNMVHLGDGLVAILHHGEPSVQEWMALLDACGFAIEPVTEPILEMEET
jgi:hypothetical protein